MSQTISDSNVFLIMGVSEDSEKAITAVVGDDNLEAAKAAFEKRFPGAIPMSYPSLEDIKASVKMVEAARDGKPLPEAFAEFDIAVIMKGAGKPKINL